MIAEEVGQVGQPGETGAIHFIAKNIEKIEQGACEGAGNSKIEADAMSQGLITAKSRPEFMKFFLETPRA